MKKRKEIFTLILKYTGNPHIDNRPKTRGFLPMCVYFSIILCVYVNTSSLIRKITIFLGDYKAFRHHSTVIGITANM